MSVQTGRETQESTDAPSLEEAIQQIINLGEKDPLSVARKIDERYDESWLREELFKLRADVVSHLARMRINGQRRSAMSGLRRGTAPSELMLVGEWIPNVGWKKLADWSEADLRSRENYYRKMSASAIRLAEWCHSCIVLMQAEGVRKLGKVKAPLPLLDEIEIEAVVNGDVI